MEEDRGRGSSEAEQPRVVDEEANRAFAALAESHGHKFEATFVGGYVEYEWKRGRHIFLEVPGTVRGLRTLEFGCHMGASAIVLDALGAKVTGIDVHGPDIGLAKLNAARHGVGDRIEFLHVPDTRELPFADGSFDLVTCNSVLEYVKPHELDAVLAELHRVTAPGGIVMILGTSNRLWPRDTHTKRWLVNYLPDVLRRGLTRSVSPFRIKRGFPGYRDVCLDDGSRILLDAKERAGLSPRKRAVAELAQRALTPLGLTVGMLAESFTLILQKPGHKPPAQAAPAS
jgi:2-polyprenyl-3-methyl-5-hydroxy-6-metoxy-1,4-benzoquinol methylase